MKKPSNRTLVLSVIASLATVVSVGVFGSSASAYDGGRSYDDARYTSPRYSAYDDKDSVDDHKASDSKNTYAINTDTKDDSKDCNHASQARYDESDGHALKVDKWNDNNKWSDSERSEKDHAYYAHMTNYKNNNDYSNDRPNLEEPYADVLLEHAEVTVSALQAEHEDSDEAKELFDAVDENSIAVAEGVEQGYPGSYEDFLAGWRAHIQYYHDYLHAAEANDEEGKEEAKQNLAAIAEAGSSFLASISPQLDKEELKTQINTHAEQVTLIIDNLVDGNLDEVERLAQMAGEHMAMIAKTLAEGAVLKNDHSYVNA